MSNSSAGLVCPKCHSADYRKLSKPLVGRFEGAIRFAREPGMLLWLVWVGGSIRRLGS